MPITFVEEHVVDRIQREKKGWGEAAVVSRAGPALRGGGACRLREPAGRSSSPREMPCPDPRLPGVRREGRLGPRLPGCFPSTRPLELQTLISEQACGGGLGVCERE